MPSEFVQSVTKYNLVTWYLLPLIHLNKFSFGQGNFLESYVTPTGTVLFVEVISIHMIPDHKYRKHYCFLSEHEGLDGVSAMVLYRLPPKWKSDFLLFQLGQFSKFSDIAKHNIIEYSGLVHGETDETGAPADDARVLALERSDVLRKAWESELNTPQGHLKGQELLDIPPPRNYREMKKP